MSFLAELKNQASALQKQKAEVVEDFVANKEVTEQACKVTLKYVQDLSAQLNVIHPPAAGSYSLDGKTAFPAMVLKNFRCDARKKTWRNEEVSDYIAVGWDIVPGAGPVAVQTLSVNFSPDLERVIQRLSMGQIRYERKELRHPDSNKLQSYIFDYHTQSRGSIIVTPEHDTAQVAFRITNLGGFELLNFSYPAAAVTQGLLDELAKKLLGQPSRFG